MKGISKFFKPTHKQKTLLFKGLDILPDKLGYYLYYKFQNLYGAKDLPFKIKSTASSFKTVRRILNAHEISLERKVCIEIGSGWLPIFPYLLLAEGKVEDVYTYDVNAHYNPSKIAKLNDHFVEQYQLDPSRFNGQYKLHKNVHYFPKTSVEDAPLEKVDLILSRFVLEHVPPLMIDSFHRTFTHGLSSGSYVLHLISPSDHRAYSDKSLSLYDFLKYSQQEWDEIQTKFDYHNRLRLPQYLKIFKEHFEVIHVEYNSCKEESEQFQKFKKLNIHSDYQSYSEEELTAGSINVLLKKK